MSVRDCGESGITLPERGSGSTSHAHTAGSISDFDTAVSANSDVVASAVTTAEVVAARTFGKTDQTPTSLSARLAYSDDVYNVRAYGAVGDGLTDDTTAIQAAIDAAAVGGGTVEMHGTFLISLTLTISSKRGVSIRGQIKAYASPGSWTGTSIRWGGAINDEMLSLFNCQDIEVSHIGFDGGDTTGLTAILVDSDNVRVSKRISLHHLGIRRANRGIQLGTAASGTQYQVDSNYIHQVGFNEMFGTNSTCIYVSSQNVDMTHIQDCEMFGSDYGVYFNRCGIIRCTNCVGGLDAGQILFYIAGPYNNLSFHLCQSESGLYFLQVASGAPASINPISLFQCTINDPVKIDQRVQISSVGCVITELVDLAGNDIQYLSLHDYLSGSGAITKNGINDRLVVIDGLNGVGIDGDGAFMKRVLRGTSTWDPVSLAAGAYTQTTISVPSATTGDTCLVAHDQVKTHGLFMYATVNSTGTVWVSLINHTGSTVDVASGTLSVTVIKH